MSELSNQGRLLSDMAVQQKLFALQQDNSERQYSNICATDVLSRGNTPRSLTQTRPLPGRP